MSQFNEKISSVSNIFLTKVAYSERGSVVASIVPSVPSTTSMASSLISTVSRESATTNHLSTVNYSDSSSSSAYSGETSSRPSSCVDYDGTRGLTGPEMIGIISVLEDTIDQLEVLGHLLPHSFDKYEGYATLEERHGGEESAKLHFYSEEGPLEVGDSLMKVQRDRLFAEAVVVRTVLELQKEKSYGPLEEAIEHHQQMDEEDGFLLEDVVTNEMDVKSLLEAVRVLERSQKCAIEEAEWAAVNLKDQTHATMVEMGIRKRYVQRWEKSRTDQKEQLNNMEEKGLRDKISSLFVDVDNENRANQEIETYINLTKQELEDSIERWMDLYDREVEDRDRAITQLRMEREVHMRAYVELQETFEKHRQEMDAWLEIREKRRAREAHEAFLNKMATRIQAWWRGTMYRKKLGPYRRRKKGGKGGSKKGGGKGGKQKGKPGKKK